MKLISVGDSAKVLVVRGYDNRFYAIGAKCSHYFGALSQGVLGVDRVRCPLHGACFRLADGEIEDAPGLDGVRSYRVEERSNGQLILHTDDEANLTNQIVRRNEARRDPNNRRRVVIVGGGPAGLTAAETLRQHGWTGSICLVCAEADAPYDRPKLSKRVDSTTAELQFRAPEHYEALSIELMLRCRADRLDAEAKAIGLSDGRTLKYDKLILAFGAEARTFPLQDGHRPSNLLYLRARSDLARILASTTGRHVVIVGSSYVGMELASSLVKRNCASVTIVSETSEPFERQFGQQVGRAIRSVAEREGVRFRLAATVRDWTLAPDGSGRVLSCTLADQTVVSGDVFVAGIGTRIASAWLDGSGVKLQSRDGAIEVG